MAVVIDKEGYLINLSDWNDAIAIELAQNENLTLTSDHWQVIHFLRYFYQQYQTTPTMRILIKELIPHLGADKANSIYLHQLFPAGLMKQACKIAGLPKPTRCM